MTETIGPLRSPAGRTLRQRLLITLSVALSPVIFLGGVQSYLFAEQSLDNRRLNLMRSADLAIDGLEQKFAKAESFLTLFDSEIEEEGCLKVYNQLKTQLSAMANIGLFDENGTAVCLSNSPEAGMSMRNSEWNQQMIAGEEIVRTEAFYGPVSEQFMFALLHRLEDEEGNFKGSVTMGLSVTELADFLESHIHDEDVDIAIVSDSGRVFGSHVFDQVNSEWVDEAKFLENTRLITAQQNGDQERDIVVTQIQQQNVYVMVSRASPGLISEFSVAPASAIGLPVLAFLLALGAAWWAVDNMILKWLKRLRRVAAVYGAGKYRFRSADQFETAPEEFEEFARTLDMMVSKIESRDANLRDALEKRDDAVREIHHRVKNNLQIVTSFLNLQSRQLKDREARNALAAARHRIDALSIVHQTLYQHERLESVSLQPFLVGLLRHLSQALGFEDLGMDLDFSIDDVERNADDAIPLALFIVETVTNGVKHGQQDGGFVRVVLRDDEENDHILLTVRNACAVSGEQQDTATSGLGSRLMEAFAAQMHGEIISGAADNNEYEVSLKLPRVSRFQDKVSSSRTLEN